MFGRIYLTSEYARIFGKTLHRIFFILFLVALFISLQFGLSRYRHFSQEKEQFIRNEHEKLDRQVRGEPCRPGDTRILYAPSPLIVLFFGHGVFDNLSARIDIAGALTLTGTDGGWGFFLKQGFFPDLAGLFYLLGSLLMVYFGLTAYIGDRHFFHPGSLLARMVILDIFFLFIMAAVYLSLSLRGITLNGTDTALFWSFALYFIIFADLFFAAGVFSRLFFSRKQTGTIAGLLFWFLLVWLIPAVLSYAGREMSWERNADFLHSVYRPTPLAGNSPDRDLEKNVGHYGRLCCFVPTAYHPFLAGEISSQGVRGYLRFARYALDQRHRFTRSFPGNSEKAGKQTGQDFLQKGENIFAGTGERPVGFWTAVCLAAFYVLVLLLSSSFLIIRRARRTTEKIPYEGTFWPDPVKPGDICYVFCYSEKIRDKFFGSFRGKETISLSHIGIEDFDPDMKLNDLFLLSRSFLQTDKERFRGYLEKLEIEPQVLGKRISQVPPGQFKNFYAGLVFSSNRSTILINDYFRGAERDYNRRLQGLLAHISREERKTIIVFSVDMFDPLAVYLQARGMNRENDYRVFQVEDITGIDL